MEAEDSTCDPDFAKDAAGAFMVVDAHRSQPDIQSDRFNQFSFMSPGGSVLSGNQQF